MMTAVNFYSSSPVLKLRGTEFPTSGRPGGELWFSRKLEPFCHHFLSSFPLKNCHQKPDFVAKIHQIQCRLGLLPEACWWSLRRSPRPASRLGRGTPPPQTPPPSAPRSLVSISPLLFPQFKHRSPLMRLCEIPGVHSSTCIYLLVCRSDYTKSYHGLGWNYRGRLVLARLGRGKILVVVRIDIWMQDGIFGFFIIAGFCKKNVWQQELHTKLPREGADLAGNFQGRLDLVRLGGS